MAGLKGSKTETPKAPAFPTNAKTAEAWARFYGNDKKALAEAKKNEKFSDKTTALLEAAGMHITAELIKGKEAETAHKTAQAKADKAAPGKPEGEKKPRESKGVTVIAAIEAKPCRAGSKQAMLVDLLSRKKGATMAELVAALSAEGKPWDEKAIRAGFYWDVKNKGYGVRTEVGKDGTQTFFLSLPEGLTAPLPHTVAGGETKKPEPAAK